MIDSTSIFGTPASSSATTAGQPRRTQGAESASFGAEIAAVEKPPPANVAAVERIKEIGFSQWAEELREQKLEEMRQEILASMGLTEEKLAAMDPDARAAIEDAIQQRINERMAAASAEGDATGPGGDRASFAAAQNPVQQIAAAAMVIGNAPGGPGGNGAAIGPAAMTVLLDAQEAAGAEGPYDRQAARRR